ncbi:hypothetical protein [Geomicrobium sp. JCM 19038]|uniref:hypothetical protein n=1 Tax=Geomicrobium sp. JCM 19038 TaxID=1460635 RepID=UPI00045F1A46|nr:hypothetical protein [Geomicrobium sp. JCM 19038]GAK08643.1 hypothetical protein JCM19038_2431 [Geomicrobium sp. JCM 19038]
MISVFKLEVWLMRSGLPLIIIIPFVLGFFSVVNNTVSPLIIVYVMVIALIQTEEKNRVNRFMYSLPLRRSEIFYARVLSLTFYGSLWLVFENVARLIIGVTIDGSYVFYLVSTFVMIMIVSTLMVSVSKTMPQGILRWIVLFVVFFLAVMSMTFVTAITSMFLEDVVGVVPLFISIITFIVGVIVFLALSIGGIAIQKRQDVV